ncbi:MAG: GHKL domain-containing protein [Clostridiales bacterium]|nr:GHKL domain-containing protein [Clostridiales bacterium]
MNEAVIREITDCLTSVMNNIQYVFFLLLIVMIAACFLGRRVEFSRKLILSAFGMLGISLTCGIIFNLLFAEADTIVTLLLNSILSVFLHAYAFVFFLFSFKEKRVRRAIESTVCFILLTNYISSFSYMTVIYLVGGTAEAAYSVFYEDWGRGPLWFAISAIGLLITLAVTLLIYFGFFKPKKYYTVSIPARIVFIVWIAVFLVLPVIPAIIPPDTIPLEYRYHIMSIMFGLCIIILGLAAPIFVIISSAERSHLEKSKTQEAYIKAELEYIEQYKRKQVETRAFRHDINNNLSLTQMLLEEGHTDKAKEHIKDLLGNISSLSPQYVTGDEMLDIIISMKADRMNELNIRFSLDGVADGGLNIKPMDMCSIFANALDNAIEAAASVDDPEISFSIKRTDKFFVIRITNSTSGKVDVEKLLDSSGYTSKSDKKHHGFGLMNVRRTVEDCNGMLKASSEENSFTLSVMLPRTFPAAK